MNPLNFFWSVLIFSPCQLMAWRDYVDRGLCAVSHKARRLTFMSTLRNGQTLKLMPVGGGGLSPVRAGNYRPTITAAYSGS